MLAGEVVQSVSVLMLGLLLWWQPFSLGSTRDGVARWFYADALVTLICVSLTIFTTRSAVHAALMQLLMACPQQLNIEAFQQALSQVEGVLSLHDLHVWQSGQDRVCSAHLVIKEDAELNSVLAECTNIAQQVYGISRTTFQVEAEQDFPDSSERLRLNGTTCHDMQ